MIACAKYDAWKAYEGFPREIAAKVYVYLINELVNDINNAKSVFEKMKGNEQDKMHYNNGLGFSVSTLNNNNNDDEKWSNKEAIFDAVVQNDRDKIIECIKAGADINMKDENGLSPLHFAADRGLDLIVSCLIQSGANIEACDNDEKTPLLYACYCEQHDVIKVLVEAGAKVDIEKLVEEDISSDTIQFIKDSLQK
jgi:ankyrin repeat protein